MTLRHAGGRLALLDRETGEAVARGRREGRTAALRPATCPTPLRAWLAGVIEMRALTAGRPGPRAAAGRWRSSTSDDKTVVRLAVETLDRRARRDRATARARLREDLERVQPRSRRRSRLPGATRPVRRRGGRRRRRATPPGRAPSSTPARRRRARHRGRRDRVRAPARGHRARTCPGRSTTSTPSSCTTCASRSAARARLQRQSGRSTRTRLRHFRESSSGCRPHRRPARPRRLPARLRRCATRSRRDGSDLDRCRRARAPARARALTATRRALKAQRTDALDRVGGRSSTPADGRADGRATCLAPHHPRVPQDGQDGQRDRRRLARRGPPRAAQGRQGAALPARVLRQPLPGRGRQAVHQDPQGPAGQPRPLPGPRGPGERAARRSRPRSAARRQ